MRIRQRLARFLLGKDFVHSATISNFLSMMGWSPANNPETLVKKIKGWSYTCINRNSMACSQVPLRLYSAKGTLEGNPKVKTAPVERRKQAFLQSGCL